MLARLGPQIRLKKALLFVPFLALLLVLSCASEIASLEERAQSIDKQLMCPVCPAETIDQSRAEIAIQMRALVRQKLQAGEDKQQILDFFVTRYGKSVLAEPPSEGFNLLVWLVPPIALAGGLALAWIAARQLGQGRALRPFDEARLQELEPYLAEVDEEFLAFERVRVTHGSDSESGAPPAVERGT